MAADRTPSAAQDRQRDGCPVCGGPCTDERCQCDPEPDTLDKSGAGDRAHAFAPTNAESAPAPEPSAAQGHWLAVEFDLRRVLDDDEAVDAALALKEAGFTVTAPEHLRSAALVREGQLDA